MIAGIITTPDRQMYLTDLVKLIAPYVDKLTIFNDLDKRGVGEMDGDVKVIHRFNLRRCIKELTDAAKLDEPVLICCDDVMTVPDWYNRFMELHSKLRQDHYQFMSRQSRLFTKENIDRGYYIGNPKGGFYDHAFILINKKGLIDRVDEWWDRVGRYKVHKNRNAHYDNIIQDYLISQNNKWVLTIPTLFNHVGVKSAYGHKIGGSSLYIGEGEE